VIRQKLRTPTVALATVCLVAACGGGASPSPSPAASQAASPGASSAASPSPSPSPIPVEDVAVQLDFNISASSGPLLWGIDQGIFEKYGINLDVIPGDGSDFALQQIDAGNVDFAYVDGSNYTAARVAEVTETTAIYALQNISTTGIASKTQINEPEDMVGKSFGTVAQSSGRQKIPLVLEMNDVDAAQVPIELMDFSVLYPSLFQDVIDTAEVGLPGSWEGAFIAAQDQGLTLYVKLISDWGYLDYSKLLIVSDSLIAENEDLVRRMVEATHEAQADALANASPEEMYQLVLAEDPQANEEAVSLTWADVQQYIIDPGPMNDETFEFQLDVIARGGTTTDLRPPDLYTNEYIPAS
jgi:NitT/TauT family transport system substrate-binding protein